MTTSEERYQKGMEVRALLGGGVGKEYRGSVPSANDLARTSSV